MNPSLTRLSVDEVAFALTQIGEAELAQSFLLMHQGSPLTQSEVRARLVAAGHSLLAREGLFVSEEGILSLDAAVAHVATMLTHAAFSLHCSLSYELADMGSTFYFRGSDVLEHWLEQGVVHQFEIVDEHAAVLKRIAHFFAPAGLPLLPADNPSGHLPLDLVEQLAREQDAAMIASQLSEAGLSTDLVGPLAEDLATTIARGAVVRVDYERGAPPRSQSALLVLQGQERLWLLRPLAPLTPGGLVELLRGSAHTFTLTIAQLLASGER